MNNLLRRAEQLARAEQRRRLAGIRAKIAEEIRQASTELRDNRIVLSGRRLLSRWLREPALRFMGRLGR